MTFVNPGAASAWIQDGINDSVLYLVSELRLLDPINLRIKLKLSLS